MIKKNPTSDANGVGPVADDSKEELRPFPAKLYKRIAKIRAYAEKPENIYRPGPDARIPGDDSSHVLGIDDYRVVYSLTYDAETTRMHRHLTIGMYGGPKRLPHPIAVFTIAHLFGFTGGKLTEGGVVTNAPHDWQIVAMPGNGIVGVGQIWIQQ